MSLSRRTDLQPTVGDLVSPALRCSVPAGTLQKQARQVAAARPALYLFSSSCSFMAGDLPSNTNLHRAPHFQHVAVPQVCGAPSGQGNSRTQA